MNRTRIAVALLAALVATGAATEVVLSLGRDVLPYNPGDRSTYYGEDIPYVQPYFAYIGLEQELTSRVRLALGGGYAGRYTFQEATRFSDTNEYETTERVKLNGFRVSATAIGQVPAVGGLFLRGGLGIGYGRYWRDYEYASELYGPHRSSASTIAGPMQTFLFGLGLRVARRVSLLVQGEVTGLSYLTESYRDMDEDGRVVRQGERSYLKTGGQADPHATGFTVGLATGI